MASNTNPAALARGGGRYSLCMPVHPGGEVDRAVISRPERYQPVAHNLGVKALLVGDGERGRRWVVRHNPLEAERQHQHREQVLGELAPEIGTLREQSAAGHSKRVCALRGSYVRPSKTGKPAIDAAKVKAAERLGGKLVVYSNDDTPSAQSMALGGKQLQRVEEAWRRLKSGLRTRPVYHRAVHRIHAHAALSVLALLLERVAGHPCGDTWRNIRDDLEQTKLAQSSSRNGTVWQVTDPVPPAL